MKLLEEQYYFWRPEAEASLQTWEKLAFILEGLGYEGIEIETGDLPPISARVLSFDKCPEHIAPYHCHVVLDQENIEWFIPHSLARVPKLFSVGRGAWGQLLRRYAIQSILLPPLTPYPLDRWAETGAPTHVRLVGFDDLDDEKDTELLRYKDMAPEGDETSIALIAVPELSSDVEFDDLLQDYGPYVGFFNTPERGLERAEHIAKKLANNANCMIFDKVSLEKGDLDFLIGNHQFFEVLRERVEEYAKLESIQNYETVANSIITGWRDARQATIGL